ncbi:YrrS family protein [Bacillus sp. AFS031507]|uniref:YrrS family protein n=1 Tax=Bacillus sp. AFS031507 TaxID=2033496 RepID=UPI000BFBBE27|nr:YrrS family protein [Bacillus sp. AFS031507]PGY07510.1 DNA primase [Bacillus sp. AFS031507]
MTNDLNSNSRSGYRSKRKKTNIVLNSLIIVVLLLIIFVAYNIFATGNDNASPKKESTKTEQKDNKDEQKESETVTTNDDDSVTDPAAEEELSEDAATTEDSSTSEDNTTPEGADESQAVVTEGDGNSNVVKATENPAWQPVGTSQTGEHTPVYDQSSADWQEMLNAISYATGLDKGNMTVYWLGRDRSTTNGSFGTVASKDKQQKFNVYLQWVDGQGWKPTKVEELAELNQ